jgi:DNA-binding MarR family transcriptional regulator
VTSIPRAERLRLAETLYALGATVVRRLPREISLTAISTMATLERSGPRRITELAVVQGVSQPSMTSLVSGLERAGYVERRPDPTDARAALVAITRDGKRTLKERRRAGTESMGTLLDKLSPEDVGRLTAALPVLQLLVDLDQELREGAG